MTIKADILVQLEDAERLVRRLLSPTSLGVVIARSAESGTSTTVEAYANYIGHVRLLKELVELDLLDACSLNALTANLKAKSEVIRPALDRLDAWRDNAHAAANDRPGTHRARLRVKQESPLKP